MHNDLVALLGSSRKPQQRCLGLCHVRGDNWLHLIDTAGWFRSAACFPESWPSSGFGFFIIYRKKKKKRLAWWEIVLKTKTASNEALNSVPATPVSRMKSITAHTHTHTQLPITVLFKHSQRESGNSWQSTTGQPSETEDVLGGSRQQGPSESALAQVWQARWDRLEGLALPTTL